MGSHIETKGEIRTAIQPASEKEEANTEHGRVFIGDPLIEVGSQVSSIVLVLLGGLGR